MNYLNAAPATDMELLVSSLSVRGSNAYHLAQDGVLVRVSVLLIHPFGVHGERGCTSIRI